MSTPGGVAHRVDAYARAIFDIVEAENLLGEVEDELFRFARVFEGNDELRTALSDPAIPAERRQAVVEELLGGKALAVSKAIASFVVGIGRVNDLPAVVNRLVEIAAESRSAPWPRSDRRFRSTRTSSDGSPRRSERLPASRSR